MVTLARVERELLVTGIGGQGIQLAALVIARAALAEGREVQLFGSYGGMMRGGNTEATLVVADGPVESPPTVGVGVVGDRDAPRLLEGHVRAPAAGQRADGQLHGLRARVRPRPVRRRRHPGHRHRGRARQHHDRVDGDGRRVLRGHRARRSSTRSSTRSLPRSPRTARKHAALNQDALRAGYDAAPDVRVRRRGRARRVMRRTRCSRAARSSSTSRRARAATSASTRARPRARDDGRT